MSYFRPKYVVLILALFGFPLLARADDSVQCIQIALSKTAFSVDAVDGNWGRRTSDAVNGIYNQLGLQTEDHEKENAAAICAKLTTLSENEKDLASIRLYPVEINSDDFAKLNGGPIFNFKKIAVNAKLNESCQFLIKRRAFHDDRREMMASGYLDVVSGHVFFGKNTWMTGGLADDTYLKEQSNLAIDEKGRIFGIMPFFHMFVRAGEEAPVPYMVELGKKRKLDEIGKHSSIWFDVNSWGDGFLEVYNCVPA